MWEDFPLEKALLWIYELHVFWPEVTVQIRWIVKNIGFVSYKCSFSHHKTSTEVVWIMIFFYQLFGLSSWWHPFPAKDPLVSDA